MFKQTLIFEYISRTCTEIETTINSILEIESPSLGRELIEGHKIFIELIERLKALKTPIQNDCDKGKSKGKFQNL